MSGIRVPPRRAATGEAPSRPRKSPRQARSRALVDAILEATIRVLVARGYEGATTIAVAEKAGVSVGSLYQYFPNKEALIAALIERHAAELVACIEATLAAADPADPVATVRAMVRAGLDAHRINPTLHRILGEQVPRVGKIAEAMATSHKLTALLQRHLERHRARLVVPDIRVAAFVVETVVEALTHRAVIEQPDLIVTAQLEAEAGTLVLGYLFGPAQAGRAAT